MANLIAPTIYGRENVGTALPIVTHAAASWQGSARLPLTCANYFDTLLIRCASMLAAIEIQKGVPTMSGNEPDGIAENETRRESETAAGMSDDLQTLLVYLKTLADQTRLRILGLLAAERRSVE